MTAALGFLKQSVAATLGPVTADGEQDVHPAPDQVVDRHFDIDRAARSAQHGAAGILDVADDIRAERQRFRPAGGIEPLITSAKAEHFSHPVAMMQLQIQRADHVVHAGTQTTAGDDAGASLLRVEKQPVARPSQFEQQLLRRWPVR